MIVYVTLDDKNGMMFNYRRQSQDKFLRNDLLKDCKGHRLWISKYSAEQFLSDFTSEFPDNIVIDDDLLRKADVNDICFIEEFLLSFHLEKIQKLVIYRWNKVYPSDFYFDIDLTNGKWTNTSITEFEGNSHEKITKEVWERKC